MPTGNLPHEAKVLWERVYNKYKAEGLEEGECAKRAWGAVRNAGWTKGEDGQWHKMSDLSEFGLVVRSVGLNKKTGERYWKASTSDILPDLYNDEMSLELYDTFIGKIKENKKPPERYCSETWDGGMPYVSVSHYREHSIAGDTDKVYIDGAILKANGTFRDSPLGRACFDALCSDLYSNHNEDQDKIRVSIAFLDYKHQHKSNGYVFERSDIDDVCFECVKERLDGERPGRIFMDGQLIHFAMTRVPVNQRTLMEVEKSMTTRKEDAASIVGEELAEELEKKEDSLVGKSEAMVVKADEQVEEPVTVIVPVEEPVQLSLDDMMARIKGIEDVLVSGFTKLESFLSSRVESVAPSDTHPLAKAYAQLRSDFDAVLLMETSTEERLKAIQAAFNALGEEVRRNLTVEEAAPEQVAPSEDSNKLLLEVLTKISDKIDLLSSQQKSVALPTQLSPTLTSIPAPRSINPARVAQVGQPQQKMVDPNDATPPKLRSLIDKSVGLG